MSSVWSLNAFGRAASISRLIRSARWSELRITLPLAMYVTHPRAQLAEHLAQAAIGTGFLPPTLIPRRSTTYLVMRRG